MKNGAFISFTGILLLCACLPIRVNWSESSSATPLAATPAGVQEPQATLPQPPRATPAAPRKTPNFPRQRAAPQAMDIPYGEGTGSDSDLKRLDIYLPETGENHPIMIYVHGGGWQRGDKKNIDFKPQAFNQAGYVFVSVNYPFVPEVDVPAQAQAIAQAVAWMHEHAADYGGNPDELYLMGHSAGAHLVALVATDPSYLEAVRLSLGSLKGVVALDTQTYNIPLLMEGRRVAGGRIYRQAFGPDPADWEKLSPITHVTPGGGIPPFIVAYSGSGEGRAAQSEQFVEKLKEAGVIAELLSASDKTHAEINREFGQPGDAVTQAIFTFLATL